MLNLSIKIKQILVNINILLVPLILIAIMNNFAIEYVITMSFIIAHEFGHILVAVILGGRINSIRILPVGLNAEIDDSKCTKLSKLYIYMSGPCVNIIFASIFYACPYVSNEFTIVVHINIWLAFFNLIPIMPLDGGKIAFEILSQRFGLFRASKKMHIFSVFLSIFIICLGLVIFKKTLYNISMVLIGSYVLLCAKGIKKETAIMNIKNFIFKKSRIIDKGIYPVREIVVMKNIKLSEVIKAMDHANMFHLVSILDEELKIIKVMTEQEILEVLMIYNADTTFEKILLIPRK